MCWLTMFNKWCSDVLMLRDNSNHRFFITLDLFSTCYYTFHGFVTIFWLGGGGGLPSGTIFSPRRRRSHMEDSHRGRSQMRENLEKMSA